jgi:hypothetical protein
MIGLLIELIELPFKIAIALINAFAGGGKKKR